jgi:aminopeptidase N
MHIPLTVGLLDSLGRDIPLNESGDGTVVLHLREKQHEFVFNNIEEEPVVSLNRNFSAPVVVDYPYSKISFPPLFAHYSVP